MDRLRLFRERVGGDCSRVPRLFDQRDAPKVVSPEPIRLWLAAPHGTRTTVQSRSVKTPRRRGGPAAASFDSSHFDYITSCRCRHIQSA